MGRNKSPTNNTRTTNKGNDYTIINNGYDINDFNEEGLHDSTKNLCNKTTILSVGVFI